MKAKLATFAGAALALSGCVCCSNCSDPVMGSWEGDLPVGTMPATSLIFSRGDGGEAKAFVLYRWGSPEWCSDVKVDGAAFSLRHPYGQLYRGRVDGDTMSAEIAPCDAKTGKQTGEWKAFDLIGENVSMLDAKVSEISPIIKSQGVDAAIAKLNSMDK